MLISILLGANLSLGDFVEKLKFGLRISALIHGCALTEIREFKFDSLKILSLGFFFFK